MTKKPVENQLAVLINESNLEQTKAQYLLDNFSSYFQIAAEWEAKAKTINVTNETQTVDMQIARVGRLFLREKRIAIEKARKSLKEQVVREGKAIDGIANVLKALIVPIEEHLDHQENFVKLKHEKEAEIKRIELEQRAIKDERIAQEKLAAEQERIRRENGRLKKEAEEKERKAIAERKKQEKLLAAERAKHETEREALEEKARLEREKQARKLKEEQQKAERNKKVFEEKARVERKKQAEKLENERKKVEVAQDKIRKQKEKNAQKQKKLKEMLKNQIKCPFCKKTFNVKEGK